MNKKIQILLSSCLVILFSQCGKKQKLIKKPDIVHTSMLPAGWHSNKPEILNQQLDTYLQQAGRDFPVPIDEKNIKILIAPHAGYYYSGLCAASAYQTLYENGKKNTNISRVIILSPNHRAFMHGVALPDYTIFRTCLGDIPIDQETVDMLKKHHLFQARPENHYQEHAIEMQLPFLQKTVQSFKIIPLIIGHTKNNDLLLIAQELKKYIDVTTLVVVSSDFVHYGTSYGYIPFTEHISSHIRHIDSLALQSLWLQSLSSFGNLLDETKASICGQDSLKLLLVLLGLKTWGPLDAHLACYYTSAQLTNKNLLANLSDSFAQESVSYISMVFAQAQSTHNSLTGYEKKALLHMARATLENSFKSETEKLTPQQLYPIISPGIDQQTGAFVTLKTNKKQLRGCIGRVLSLEPLYKTVYAMSLAAAFHDARFSPLTKQELASLTIQISILSEPKKVSSYHDIVIGQHGIILNKKNTNGTIIATSVFLPQVPIEHNWTLETTLEELSEKSGLERNAWKTDCDFEIFQTQEISE